GEIALVTYTKNAAARMREKLEELVPPIPARQVWTSTFHDWCFELLNRHGRGFEVLEEDDLWIEMRRRLASGELRLEHFTRAAAPGEFLDDLLRFFERCHDELVNVGAYSGYVQRVIRGEVPLPHVGKDDEE